MSRPADVTDALARDARGESATCVDDGQLILEAALAAPQDFELAVRAVNSCVFRGESAADCRRTLNRLLDVRRYDERCVRMLVLPAGEILLWAADWQNARELLNEVPVTLRCDRWHAADLELNKLADVLDHDPPVCWERAGTRWWERPAQLPAADREGRPLQRWLAGRVERRDGDAVVIRCGEADTSGTQPQYSWLNLPYTTWRSEIGSDLADGEPDADIFLEIGVYSDDSVNLRLMPTTGLRRLTAQPVPHPNRFLRPAA
jgi:hypothetical protein